MAWVQSTQTSGQQVAWYLLGYNIVKSSIKTVRASVAPPDDSLLTLQINSEEDQAFSPQPHEIDADLKQFFELDVETQGVSEISFFDFLTWYKKSAQQVPKTDDSVPDEELLNENLENHDFCLMICYFSW
mmetsp:Transcript_39992/g.93655  ORF Transcript_39992/g.93655 Transcript_39992/m.93655 type:complete len:130 (+) Transcript_39992:74-463(+)